MAVSPTIRNRPEAQGVGGLDDATLGELAPWVRWTHTFGALVTIIGVVSMSPAVLWTLAAITLGVPLILVAVLASVTHICIPSMIHHTIGAKHHRIK